jgi:hypothetical protein
VAIRDDAVYEIAYEEAVRALSEQHGVIESFRARAGLLLSSAAVTTSFLAGKAFRDGRTGIFAWLALLDFAAVVILTLAILKPRHWETSVKMDESIEARLSTEGEVPPRTLHLAIALRLRRALAENRDALEHLSILLQLAGSLLAAEIVLWLAAIATAA